MTQLVYEVILIYLKNLPITLQLIVKSDFFTSSNWTFAEKTNTKFSIDSPLKNGISFIQQTTILTHKIRVKHCSQISDQGVGKTGRVH